MHLIWDLALCNLSLGGDKQISFLPSCMIMLTVENINHKMAFEIKKESCLFVSEPGSPAPRSKQRGLDVTTFVFLHV